MMSHRKNSKPIAEHLIKEWHPTKNGNLDLNLFSSKSGKKVWWICQKGHEWQATIQKRTIGRKCPFCIGKRASFDNNLEIKNPEIAKQWHPTKNGNITPRNITSGCNKKFWWLCEKGHEWMADPRHRTNNRGCPYCSGNLVCSENSLETKFPEIAKEWNVIKNGNLKPSDVGFACNKKVWWKCKNNHEWETTIAHRTNKSIGGGTNCPFCSKRISKPGQLWLDSKNIITREIYIKIGKTKFFIDGFDVENNTIYEFLGDYWHGNLNKYKAEDRNRNNNKTFGELYNKTIERFTALKTAGYRIIYRWESSDTDEEF